MKLRGLDFSEKAYDEIFEGSVSDPFLAFNIMPFYMAYHVPSKYLFFSHDSLYFIYKIEKNRK